MEWKGLASSAVAQLHVTFVAGGKVLGASSFSVFDLPASAHHAGVYGWLDDGTGSKLRRRQVPAPGVIACPDCGLTWADYQREGRLGCGSCWETFREDLEADLKGLHRGGRHVGKQPRIAVSSHACD